MNITVFWFKFHWIFSECQTENKLALGEVLVWNWTGSYFEPIVTKIYGMFMTCLGQNTLKNIFLISYTLETLGMHIL